MRAMNAYAQLLRPRELALLKPLHLLTLKAVVRSESFALAARDLGYTASAISQQISSLEKETGLVLFEREAHGIRPTAAAHRLVDLSTHVLAAMDDLDHQVQELATGATGRLRLGSFPTADVRLVPSALSALVETHPRAQIQLEEAEPEELITALSHGDLDVALVYEYGLSPRQWPAGLTRHHLLREDLLLLRARERAERPAVPAVRGPLDHQPGGHRRRTVVRPAVRGRGLRGRRRLPQQQLRRGARAGLRRPRCGRGPGARASAQCGRRSHPAHPALRPPPGDGAAPQ